MVNLLYEQMGNPSVKWAVENVAEDDVWDSVCYMRQRKFKLTEPEEMRHYNSEIEEALREQKKEPIRIRGLRKKHKVKVNLEELQAEYNKTGSVREAIKEKFYHPPKHSGRLYYSERKTIEYIKPYHTDRLFKEKVIAIDSKPTHEAYLEFIYPSASHNNEYTNRWTLTILMNQKRVTKFDKENRRIRVLTLETVKRRALDHVKKEMKKAEISPFRESALKKIRITVRRVSRRA